MIQGVAYYPEWVNSEEWERDLQLMKEYGFNAVRIAEFCWSTAEPEEGVWNWDWLDRFWELAEKTGLDIVLCTPTAAVPTWLIQHYPEVAAVLRDGTALGYGERRNVCVNSPVYRRFCERIIRQMATRYGQRRSLLGWQIDNELIGPEGYPFECHCRECEWRFRQWLQERYPGIDALNRAWYLGFWSLEFSNWSQVPTPRCQRVPKGHYLEFLRFQQASQEDFIRFQYKLLRDQTHPAAFVSHNSTGIFDRGIDHVSFARCLDVCGWDAYRGAASGGHPDKKPFTALAHELFRSALNRPFKVFETNTDPLQSPAYLAQARAYGADSIYFWLWRRHRGNMEQNSEAFCDYAGRPYRQRLERIRETFQRLREYGHPTVSRAAVALVFDADCVRLDYRRATRPIPYLDRLVKAYRAVWELGLRVDIVTPQDELQAYRLVLAPALELMSETTGRWLREYVEQGGSCIVTGPTARYDYYGVFYPQWGEPIAPLIATTFSDDLKSLPAEQMIHWENTGYFPVSGAFDVPAEDVAGADILARFSGSELDGKPAIWQHPCGKGKCLYCVSTETDLFKKLLELWQAEAELEFHRQPDRDCAVVAEDGAGALWYLNLSETPVRLDNGNVIAPGDFYVDRG
ncbi:MAG: hypothetical protein D6820_04770 [Lentisphaerae bacterium]|nr:MAG: hypothetical protein D6820_04770 [Lentisphaerota bacterium]